MKTILELAKDHQVIRAFGGCKLNNSRTDKRKDVKCNVCSRDMDVREHENPPYYCYKCDEESEVQQR